MQTRHTRIFPRIQRRHLWTVRLPPPSPDGIDILGGYRASPGRGGAGNMHFRSLLTKVLPAVALCCGGIGAVVASEAFTIIDAINQAVQTNPSVGESAANR